jgi:EAL domain-containing protein (putative c-di-GMP-specific phosphodiesterase class I)
LVSLDNNRITGFEALARWESAEFGQVAPDVFIPIAEECGLIGELGDQMLRHACLDASAWPKDIRVAVNLSAIQLRDDTLGLRILSILAETDLPPHRLELELTESVLVDNFSKAQRVIEPLRQAGVRIALDDFGTGYATIAQLRKLHLDRIKIDRSFVDLVCKDPESLVIVRAILGLASGFGLSTLAEGIEDAQQLACLKETGCLEGPRDRENFRRRPLGAVSRRASLPHRIPSPSPRATARSSELTDLRRRQSRNRVAIAHDDWRRRFRLQTTGLL